MDNKSYEIMTITKVSLGEDSARDTSNKIKDLITQKKGKVINSNFMGKKKFAYEISHESEGYYDNIEFELSPKEVEDLKTQLNYFEELTRYLITTA